MCARVPDISGWIALVSGDLNFFKILHRVGFGGHVANPATPLKNNNSLNTKLNAKKDNTNELLLTL